MRRSAGRQPGFVRSWGCRSSQWQTRGLVHGSGRAHFKLLRRIPGFYRALAFHQLQSMADRLTGHGERVGQDGPADALAGQAGHGRTVHDGAADERAGIQGGLICYSLTMSGPDTTRRLQGGEQLDSAMHAEFVVNVTLVRDDRARGQPHRTGEIGDRETAGQQEAELLFARG
jgi:hypothetical protein